MNFEELYSRTNDHLKLKFLNAIIRKNPTLQNEFEHFIQSEKNVIEVVSTSSFMEILTSTKKKYQDDFEMVDTENPDWENYHAPHSGYIEDWEAYQQASEQEFEEVFEAFNSEALNKIIGQKPDELIAMLIGLYEATQDAEIEDKVSSFEDINEYLLSEFQATMNSIIEKLSLSALSERTIVAAIEKFVEYSDAEYPGNEHFVGYFEHLLIALAEKSSSPNQILSVIDNSTIERQAVPEMVLLLNKLAGNTSEWLQSALQFYRINNEVAKQLLKFYFDSDKVSFVKTANELFQTDKRVWAKFLKDFVSVELDKSLYVNIFRHLAVNEKQIKYYLKIKEYLNDSDINSLLEEVDWDKLFVVEILEVEKRYESIRKIVEKNSSDWQYEELIRPILTVYPEFCFQHIKNKTIITIENQRGRDIYERIANWLKLTQKIPGFDTEKRDLVNQLYNHKPNLPALKDELRKAKLV